MRFIWDDRKRLSNIDKHGLDFEDVLEFEWETALIATSYGDRFKAIGYFRDGTSVVVYAILGSEAVSIISFRPARRKERQVLNDSQI